MPKGMKWIFETIIKNSTYLEYVSGRKNVSKKGCRSEIETHPKIFSFHLIRARFLYNFQLYLNTYTNTISYIHLQSNILDKSNIWDTWILYFCELSSIYFLVGTFGLSVLRGTTTTTKKGINIFNTKKCM